MRHETLDGTDWHPAQTPKVSGTALDCETLVLIRSFLAPILEAAESWAALAKQLEAKGYRLAFHAGHLVIENGQGEALCTGSAIGVPLAKISQRIGRPTLRLNSDGISASLR